MPKLGFLKLVLALWLIVWLATFSIVIPVANAESRGVVFYGSRWGMTQEEIDAAREVINYIKNLFGYGGYNCSDWYGSQTQKQNVLNYASLMEESFDYVAVFYHGHAGKMNLDGVLHWDFFDDEGPQTSNNWIWDYEI